MITREEKRLGASFTTERPVKPPLGVCVCNIKKLRLFFLKVSPVLADKSDVFELKMVEKFPQNQAVELMSVMGGICVLVRLPKTWTQSSQVSRSSVYQAFH